VGEGNRAWERGGQRGSPQKWQESEEIRGTGQGVGALCYPRSHGLKEKVSGKTLNVVVNEQKVVINRNVRGRGGNAGRGRSNPERGGGGAKKEKENGKEKKGFSRVSLEKVHS